MKDFNAMSVVKLLSTSLSTPFHFLLMLPTWRIEFRFLWLFGSSVFQQKFNHLPSSLGIGDPIKGNISQISNILSGEVLASVLDEVTKSFSIKVQWGSTWKWHRVSCNIRSTTWSRTLKRDPEGRRQTIKRMILMILMIISPEQWTSHFLLHHERCKWGWKGSCSEEREPFDQKTKDKTLKTKDKKNVKRSPIHLFHRTNHIAHRAFNLHWLKKEKTLINSENLHPWFQRCKNLLNSVCLI